MSCSENASLAPGADAELSLCAKLHWCTSHIIVPSFGPMASRFKHWGVTLIAAERHGSVSFAVFEDDEATRRFIVFRGYACGTRLPTPCPVRVAIRGGQHMVNLHPWSAWYKTRHHIEPFATQTNLRVIVTGHSIGCAYAVFTAITVKAVASIYLFSPFPFADKRLTARIDVPCIQLWLRGDSLVWFYHPIFQMGARCRDERNAYKRFMTPFGYHNTQSIALSLSCSTQILQEEMSALSSQRNAVKPRLRLRSWVCCRMCAYVAA